MTLLAAFQTLLYRYTGQTDISVGSPIANRNRTEIEGLIGIFVNTLVMRTDCAGKPSFKELLGRVRKMALEAYAHQDFPFEKLVVEPIESTVINSNGDRIADKSYVCSCLARRTGLACCKCAAIGAMSQRE
jgi:hypothetical protein